MIYCLNSGRIIECGTHNDLMNLKGQYYSLVINQESAKKENDETEEAFNQQDDTTTDKNSKLGRYFVEQVQFLLYLYPDLI